MFKSTFNKALLDIDKKSVKIKKNTWDNGEN